MLRVGNEFFDSPGGAHIAAYDNENYPWRMCCNGIIGGLTAGQSSTFLNTGNRSGGLGFESEYDGGSHGMTGNYSEPADKDVRIANDIIYNDQGCPEGFKCAGKITPLDFNASGTYNGHIWDCNQTFETIDMISICYKPMKSTDCAWNVVNHHAGWCDEPGLFLDPITGNWLYCSFGKDDIQQEGEDGACCLPGEFSLVKDWGPPVNLTCVASDECGFASGRQCDFDHEDPGPPAELYQREYFAKEGCIDWETDKSCCWHIYKYNAFGNYPCNIFDILDLSTTEPN